MCACKIGVIWLDNCQNQYKSHIDHHKGVQMLMFAEWKQ